MPAREYLLCRVRGFDVYARSAAGWISIEARRWRSPKPEAVLLLSRWDADPLPASEESALVGTFLDRLKNLPLEGGSAGRLPDQAWSAKYPECAALLEAQLPPSRGAGNRFGLSVWLAPDGLKASIRDKELSRVLFVTLKAPADLWKGLEGALAAEEPDWRLDRFQGHPEAKRVKR